MGSYRTSCSLDGTLEGTRGACADCCIYLLQQSSVKNVFIRGSVVRYVHLPANAVDTPLLEDATRRGTKLFPDVTRTTRGHD
jgi:hypothetical protein